MANKWPGSFGNYSDMKKVMATLTVILTLTVLSVSATSETSDAALSSTYGSGTSDDPYSGTLVTTSAWDESSWSSDVYISFGTVVDIELGDDSKGYAVSKLFGFEVTKSGGAYHLSGKASDVGEANVYSKPVGSSAVTLAFTLHILSDRSETNLNATHGSGLMGSPFRGMVSNDGEHLLTESILEDLWVYEGTVFEVSLGTSEATVDSGFGLSVDGGMLIGTTSSIGDCTLSMPENSIEIHIVEDEEWSLASNTGSGTFDDPFTNRLYNSGGPYSWTVPDDKLYVLNGTEFDIVYDEGPVVGEDSPVRTVTDGFGLYFRLQNIELLIEGVSSHTGTCDILAGSVNSDSLNVVTTLVIVDQITYDHSALAEAGVDTSGLPTAGTIIDAATTYPNLGTIGGYEHTGWLVDGVHYETGSPVASVSAHIAKSVWQIPSVTITFVSGGTTYATLSVPKGSTAVVFTPENVDGIFTGWFYDSDFQEEYDPLRPLDSDILLYARGVPPLDFTTDPVADGHIQAVSGEPGTVSFRATDSMYYTSVLWNFGDGHTSTDLYAKHHYDEPGTYQSTLTVFNNHGSDVVEYLVHVPSADAGDDEVEWGLFLATTIVIVIGGALIMRKLL